MAFFEPTDFQIFTPENAKDGQMDPDRVRLRDKMAWLHEQIYPEIRARRWDVHPHWNPQYLISTARVSRSVPRIDFLLLRYSKAETVVKLIRKEFGQDLSHPDSTALLGVRADGLGISIELDIGEKAWADARNLKNKLVHGAPEKRHLRQIFAELGGDYTLTLDLVAHNGEEDADVQALRAKCSRLVNLGTLDSTLSKYEPSDHRLKVAIQFAADDPRLGADTLPAEILYRLGQLYLLYQFVSWSPRNDYLSRPNSDDRTSVLNP